MDFSKKIPQDGEVYALSLGENKIHAEFLSTNGRIGWRLYDRLGRGILLTEKEIRNLVTLSLSALKELDKDGKKPC